MVNIGGANTANDRRGLSFLDYVVNILFTIASGGARSHQN